MTTVYDTSTEVDTAEAERLLRRPAKQVRNLWRAGLLKGRMEQTVALLVMGLWGLIEVAMTGERTSPKRR